MVGRKIHSIGSVGGYNLFQVLLIPVARPIISSLADNGFNIVGEGFGMKRHNDYLRELLCRTTTLILVPHRYLCSSKETRRANELQ
jgi:hypothetical protein